MKPLIAAGGSITFWTFDFSATNIQHGHLFCDAKRNQLVNQTFTSPLFRKPMSFNRPRLDLTITQASTFDAVSDLMHNWVAQRSDFKSALRVVKMVLNTQCYQYLWLTMWFHAKKIERNTKKIKIADFTMQIRLPSSEMTKNRQKNGSLNRDLLNFFV